MKKYYRVLDDSPRDKRHPDQSTLRRWKRGEYNSTNEAPPNQWRLAWKQGCRRKTSFLLKNRTGLSTRRARRLFLAIANRHGINSKEMARANYRVGELQGPCAYRTPEGAWKHTHGIVKGNWIAEFEGIEIPGVTIPESLSNPDAVQVSVLKPLRVIPAVKFAEEHGFALPDSTAPAEFVDSVKYEEDL